MKVGDYVRTPLGITKYIGKYDNYEGFYEFDKLDEELWTGDIANVVYTCEIDNIVLKSSPNIIDLIGENDLITIEFYSLRYSERVTRLFEVTYKDDEYIVLDNAKCSFMLKNNDFNRKDKQLEPIIKSIVTKEQFESMKYEVD